ncbi:MAG: RNA 2',3'-cyclic phosphodiesterase [Candidatus Acidiferrum sp.]
MRLFVAIQIPERVRTTFGSLVDEFGVIDPRIKWVKSENLHITLKFLGRADTSQLASVVEVLSTIARSAHPIILDFVGVGCFPNARKPNILWAGIEASANVRTIVREMDQRLAVLGFPLEEREFTPHVTLGRFDKTPYAGNLQIAIGRNTSREFGGFKALDFHLVESTLKSSGAEYTILHSFPFTAEA